MPLRGNVGARYVTTDQHVGSVTNWPPVRRCSTTVDRDYDDVLPS